MGVCSHLLLVYKKIIDLYEFILYPATLVKMLIINKFASEFWESFMLNIISSAKIWFDFYFSYLYHFSFFLLPHCSG